jgi:transcriptional regulator with XRE-family HTH domain
MTKEDRRALLLRTIEEKGQAATARALGVSASALSQIKKGTYGADMTRILQKVGEIFGSETVNCPVMGAISLKRCAEERRKPCAATSPQRVRLWQACRECEGSGR